MLRCVFFCLISLNLDISYTHYYFSSLLFAFYINELHMRSCYFAFFTQNWMLVSIQEHPEELGALVEVLKSGMVTSVSGYPYKLPSDAKCDVMGALWRILGVNNAAQRVFGDATAFSLLLTTLHSFQGDERLSEESSLLVYIKLFTYLLRLMTAGVCGNAINRTKLHAIISSHTFYDLLSESGLLCVDHEKQVIHLLLELALEIVLPPFMTSGGVMSADVAENESTGFLFTTPSGLVNLDKGRVYNAGAVKVLIRSLLLFTSKVQLEVLDLIGKLAHSGPFNQENLTSVGEIESTIFFMPFP